MSDEQKNAQTAPEKENKEEKVQEKEAGGLDCLKRENG